MKRYHICNNKLKIKQAVRKVKIHCIAIFCINMIGHKAKIVSTVKKVSQDPG